MLLVWGKQNALLLRGRGAMQAGRRLGGKAFSYSKKIKFSEWRRSRRGERIDREIYEGVSFLRNMIALGNGRGVSSDYVIEEPSRKAGALQPVYMMMLRFLRLGKLEDAVKAFSGEAFTPIGHEFGDLLLRWDALDPLELTEILVSYQKSIKEAKSTSQRKRDEIVSDLIYFPVVLNVFIVFINFIVVGYFMEQRNLLNMLF